LRPAAVIRRRTTSTGLPTAFIVSRSGGREPNAHGTGDHIAIETMGAHKQRLGSSMLKRSNT
jgi:hypothetical protein